MENQKKISQQKVPHILLDYDFLYCGLRRGVVGSEVGSEGFIRFPSPHSLVGWDEFVFKSIPGLFFKVGLGIFSKNTDSQRNPVHYAFNRFFCCGNQTIHR